MADPEHEAILAQGKREWNRWRRTHSEVTPDLSREITPGDDFEGDLAAMVAAVLNQVAPGRAPTDHEGMRGADLSHYNLRGANLSGALLDGAMLVETDLRGADLSAAHLTGCVLTGAKARGANLRSADLTAATLRWADLTKADLSDAVLRQANLSEVVGTSADLRGADLGYSTFVGGSLRRADLTGARVYGTSSWDVDLTGAAQSGLVITRPDEPAVSVDDLRLAQFLHLVISNANVRTAIDAIATKVVLILGRFTPERTEVLRRIHAMLRRRDLVPVLFDFERPHTRDLTETITTLAHLARFVVADLTDPSSLPKELEAIVPTLAVPVVPLLLRGNEPYAMFRDYWKYDWVLPIVYYDSGDDLVRHFDRRVLRVAQRSVATLQERRNRAMLR